MLEMDLGPEVMGASDYSCCHRLRNPDQETPSVKRQDRKEESTLRMVWWGGDKSH